MKETTNKRHCLLFPREVTDVSFAFGFSFLKGDGTIVLLDLNFPVTAPSAVTTIPLLDLPHLLRRLDTILHSKPLSFRQKKNHPRCKKGHGNCQIGTKRRPPCRKRLSALCQVKNVKINPQRYYLASEKLLVTIIEMVQFHLARLLVDDKGKGVSSLCPR